MHDTQVKTLTVKEARNRFSEIIERAAIGGDVFVITKFGKQKAVIAPPSKVRNGSISVFKTKQETLQAYLTRTAGMWRGRKDMKDGASWVDTQREGRYGKIFG